MKKILVIALLTLTACSPMETYQPLLAEKPESSAKYKADLSSCRFESEKRNKQAVEAHKDDKAIPLFGLLGLAVGSATADKDDAYYLTDATLIDRCMTKRGYKIAN